MTPPQQPWAATTTWTITGATPGETVILTANATNAGGGSAPGTDQCCSGQITIVMPDCPKQVGEVTVEKKVKNDTRASASVIDSLVFPIGLSCTAPSNLNVSFGLNNGGAHTENNVPYTSVCTVTESVSTLPAAPKDVCGEGSAAVWLTPVITPSSATINAPVTAFTVVNELKCVPVGTLSVTKEVENHAPLPIPVSTIFSVSVSCGAPANINVSFGLTDTASHTVSGIAYSSLCAITEATPPSFNVCPPNSIPVWTQHYLATNTPTIAVPVTTVTLLNRLDCMPKLPPACVSPLVANADGICGCPPPSVLRGTECVRPIVCQAPLTPNAAGTDCVCRPGMTLRGGKCVTPIVCQAPLIPNAAGTDCVCRPGLTLRGGRCVEPIVCREPAIPDRAGTACICPNGWVKKGDRCVAPDRERQGIMPNGINRLLPGMNEPGRGGATPGGGDSPGGAPGKR